MLSIFIVKIRFLLKLWILVKRFEEVGESLRMFFPLSFPKISAKILSISDCNVCIVCGQKIEEYGDGQLVNQIIPQRLDRHFRQLDRFVTTRQVADQWFAEEGRFGTMRTLHHRRIRAFRLIPCCPRLLHTSEYGPLSSTFDTCDFV